MAQLTFNHVRQEVSVQLARAGPQISISKTHKHLILTSLQRPAGIPGPSALPGNIFGYLGCYAQTGASSSTSGKALSNFQATYTTLGNSQCSQTCRLGNFNYYGTVNVGSASVDCYCGNAIRYERIPSGSSYEFELADMNYSMVTRYKLKAILAMC